MGASADRVQIVVHIDQAILAEAAAAKAEGPHSCELEDGPALALDTARRLACDSTVVGLGEAENGEPLDIGARRAPSRRRSPGRSKRATAAAAIRAAIAR